MATQPHAPDQGQLQTIVAWLEEQRRQDRDELARLAAEIDRLGQTGREQAGLIVELRQQVDEGRTALQRLPILDDALRSAREQLSEAADRNDQQSQQVTQTLLLRGADAERDRKQIAELVGQVDRLDDLLQSVDARVRVVADEVRRERAHIQEIPATVHAVDQRVAQLAHRLDQVEERFRRLENLVGSKNDQIDEIRNEIVKATQWRQLADVRWTRQAAEWQQTLEDFRQTAEENARPVQQLISQVSQARDDVRGVQSLLTEHTRRLEETAAALARLDATLSLQREAVARLEQTADAQRRRFDEQASAHLRLDEAIGRGSEQSRGLERLIEEHGRRIDETQATLRQIQEDVARSREELSRAGVELRQDMEAGRIGLAAAIDRLQEVAAAQAARATEAAGLAREHRQRLSMEFERQAREMGELRPNPGSA